MNLTVEEKIRAVGDGDQLQENYQTLFQTFIDFLPFFSETRGSCNGTGSLESNVFHKHRCPDCGEENLEKIGYDHRVGKIWKCRNCGSGWSDFQL